MAPTTYVLITSDPERIKQKLLSFRCIEGECWIWLGFKSRGYGTVRLGDSKYRVSRVAAMVWNDFDISSRLEIMHICDNRACFNPKHLMTGTHSNNIINAVAKGRWPDRTEKMREAKRLKRKLKRDSKEVA